MRTGVSRIRWIAAVVAVVAVVAVLAITNGLPSTTTSSGSSSSSSNLSSSSSPSSASSLSSSITSYSSSSQSVSSSTCTLYLTSGGFTASASATWSVGACEQLLGIVIVQGCPQNMSSSITVCTGPEYASYSATGSGTSSGVMGADVPSNQRVEIDLYGALPELQCISSNCSSATLLSDVLNSCCDLVDQYSFSAPGQYSFAASWTSIPFFLTSCTVVSTSSESSGPTPVCTTTSGTTSTSFTSQSSEVNLIIVVS